MAVREKALFRWISMFIQNLSKTSFLCALGNTTVLACRPARLKVLVPEMPVMTLAAISGDRVAVGMCFLPWKIRSEWISSETTST